METLATRSGWEIVEAQSPDYRGPVFKNGPKNVIELLQATVTKHPDRVGFTGGDWRLTYRQFREAAEPLAAGLEDAGFAAGDRAAIIMTNQPKWLISACAVFFAGGVVVPLDYKLSAAEHLQLLEH